MADAVLDYYLGLFRRLPLLTDGICWTVVSPLHEPVAAGDVAARLAGGGSPELTPMPFDAAFDHDDRRILHLRQLGDAVAVLEVNGGLAALTAVLERLSAGARVHTASWNINGAGTLAYAEAGDVRVKFEALFPDQRSGSEPGALDDCLPPLFEALRAPRTSFRPVLLSMVERRTGIRLTPDWFTEDTPAMSLAP
jgi:hypothetical protein